MRDTWQVYPNVASVTPSDTANLSKPAMALYITGTGTIKFDTVGGQTGVSMTGIPANSILPFQVTKVYAGGTSATGIFALW